MLLRGDEVLDFRDDRLGPDADPGLADDLAPAEPPPEAAERETAGPRRAQSRTKTVVEIDDALRAIADLLDLLKQKTSRGSQAAILVEGAAVATQRASRLAQGLLAGE